MNAGGGGGGGGGGRKPKLLAAEIEKIRTCHENGETITALAKEYGISRQALSRYLNQKTTETEMVCQIIRQWAKLNQRFQAVNVMDYNMRIDFMCEEECCTVILVNFREKRIAIENETDEMIHRAFGIKAKPTWEDFEEFLESRCFPRTRDGLRMILDDIGLDFYDPLAIVEKTKGRMAEDFQWMKFTYFRPEADICGQ